MYKSKRILTIIPARGGSKGIKNKNLMRIGRYTLLEHVKNIIKPIEKKLDYVWVSTDSIKIINHCKKIGLNTPFVRPKKFSSNFANISDVLLHSINFLEKKVKQKADYIYTNYYYEVNPEYVKKYSIPSNFKLLKSFTVDNTIVYSIYKKN